MKINIQDLLDSPSVRDKEKLEKLFSEEEILPGLTKGMLGTVVVKELFDKNLLGLSLATFVASGTDTLNKIFSRDKKEIKHRKTLYVSMGDSPFMVTKAFLSLLDKATDSQKELAKKNLAIEILPPCGKESDLKNKILATFKDVEVPELIVFNASSYINNTIDEYGFQAQFTNEIWTLAVETKAAVVVIMDPNTKKFLTKDPVAWKGSLSKISQLNKRIKYKLEIESSTENWEVPFIFANETMIVPVNEVSKNTTDDPLQTVYESHESVLCDGVGFSTGGGFQHFGVSSTEQNEKKQPQSVKPGHIFIKSFKEFPDGEGKSDFDIIMENLNPKEKVPLAILEGGKTRLKTIQKTMDLEFPWFSKITAWVLQDLHGKLTFSEKTKNPVVISIPALLLVGPTGIGKTEWAATFAENLGIPFDAFSLGGAATSIEYITSLSRWWKKPKPSRILAFVAKQKMANPLFLLDEIDKQSSDDRYGNSQQSLLAYLDRNASNLYDDFLEGYIDVTKLNLIATANTLSQISEPLLSRMEVVEVQRPDPEHAKPIFEKMHKRFAQEMGVTTDLVPISDHFVKTIEKDLSEKKDLRVVWQDVKASMLKEVLGFSEDHPGQDKRKVGFGM